VWRAQPCVMGIPSPPLPSKTSATVPQLNSTQSSMHACQSSPHPARFLPAHWPAAQPRLAQPTTGAGWAWGTPPGWHRSPAAPQQQPWPAGRAHTQNRRAARGAGPGTARASRRCRSRTAATGLRGGSRHVGPKAGRHAGRWARHIGVAVHAQMASCCAGQMMNASPVQDSSCVPTR